ncbi:PilZ domain-containing protein [Pseudomonas cuatrocienegasensis]|uniref:PilZ domain-containing protein n=1 Tax=Pseudomonas cuatrocienegasensis TaxID=543360 RepID=A0ABY1BAF2_9PSED|nr:MULTISPECIES: PilZ domain-containing protein [Pseudomonas]OEC34959.1 pilus assembly protein PilZ [Pseudomonas sp. 21C1]SEQ37851.1 PilZ domain-containing protein [Pseudomonas cuatrocienegasensis]
MSTQDADDRREYYRIDDTIALDFTPLRGAEALASDVLHDSSPLFNLLSDLHLMDFESQHLLRHIGERDRTLANYLKVMNKRIDLLGQAVAQGLLRDIGTPKQVSLSEGGVSFTSAQAVAVGEHLAIKMVLMPQALGLLLRAQVIHCRALADQQFEIGTEFEALTEAQRQLLARHILQRQALERRQAREQTDPS